MLMNDCGEVYGPCPQYSFKRTLVKIEVLQSGKGLLLVEST